MSKRVNFNIYNFPFDNLRINGKNGLSRSDFNTIHQATKIETSPGVLEEYSITLPEMQSDAISYYIDASLRNIMNPTLYIHPIIHPKWSTLNDNGEHTRDEEGDKIDEFFRKWEEAFRREWSKLSKDDRIWFAGIKMGVAPTETVLEQAIQHPKFPKTHQKVGQRDEDKPASLSMALWSQDIKKRKKENDSKKKFSYLKKAPKTDANSSPGKNTINSVAPNENADDVLMIPDTDEIVYCAVRDVTKANKRKIGTEKAGEKIKTYEPMKKFIYNANDHPNASNTNCQLLVIPTILGPSVLWSPDKNQEGNIKLKVCDLNITFYKPISHNKAIPVDEINNMAKGTEEKMSRFGLTADDSEDEAGEDTKEEEQPLFSSEFEKTNWEEQRECKRQLKILSERRASLHKQRDQTGLTDQKKAAIKKELALIDTKYRKKIAEQLDLEKELDEMQNPNGDDLSAGGEGDENDDGEREDDSGHSH